MAAIQTKIINKIQKQGRGKVFTTKDFLDVGTRDAVDQALSRLARKGLVRRLGRGLYYNPRINKALGIELAPDTSEIADALGRQTGSRVIPSGAVAANWLGLTTQVPAKDVFLTDGRSRQVKIGNRLVTIKHVVPKDLPVGSPRSAMVFQALRYLGQEAVDKKVISHLKQKLSAKDKQELQKEVPYTTDWLAAAVQQIVMKDESMIHG